MRDFNKAAELGRGLINTRRDLRVDDMASLIADIKAKGTDSIIDAIAKAYYAGFMQGYEQRGAKDKRAASISEAGA